MNRFALRYDDDGHACAITCDGWDVLHIVPGSVVNQQCQGTLVSLLNDVVDGTEASKRHTELVCAVLARHRAMVSASPPPPGLAEGVKP